MNGIAFSTAAAVRLRACTLYLATSEDRNLAIDTCERTLISRHNVM